MPGICTTLAPFIYWKLLVSIEERQRAHPKKLPKIYENLDFHCLKTVYKLLKLGAGDFPRLWLYIYSKYIGNAREEGVFTSIRGCSSLPSEPVSQYSCKNFLKLMIMIEHIKKMQIPRLDIWSMLLSGQVPHRNKSLVLESERPC